MLVQLVIQIRIVVSELLQVQNLLCIGLLRAHRLPLLYAVPQSLVRQVDLNIVLDLLPIVFLYLLSQLVLHLLFDLGGAWRSCFIIVVAHYK